MAKAILNVFTNCPSEKEAEFNRWYDETHLPDILAIEGFVGARRYKLSGPGPQMVTRGGDPAVAQYLAVYELDTDDTKAAMGRLGPAVADLQSRGRMFDGMQTVGAASYVALGDRQEAAR